jgi:hypothetical protein
MAVDRGAEPGLRVLAPVRRAAGPVIDGQRVLYLRADADPMAVLEIRRRSAERLQLQTLADADFDRRLRESTNAAATRR